MYWQSRSIYEETQTGFHGSSTNESTSQGRKIQVSKRIFFHKTVCYHKFYVYIQKDV